MKRFGLVLVLGLVLACSQDTAPTAGILNVSFSTPNAGGDGAVLLSITGPQALTSAAAASGLTLYSLGAPYGTTNRFIIVGTLPSSTILTIGVADVSKSSSYTVSISQVAATDNSLRSLVGYSAAITR